MQSKIVIIFALVALTFAEDVTKSKDEKPSSSVPNTDTKKDKRGLFALGYGYGLDSGLGTDSYFYSSYPALHSGSVSSIVTKEIAAPQTIVVEKQVKVPYPVHITKHVEVPKPYAVPVVKHVPYVVSQPVYIQKYGNLHGYSGLTSW